MKNLQILIFCVVYGAIGLIYWNEQVDKVHFMYMLNIGWMGLIGLAYSRSSSIILISIMGLAWGAFGVQYIRHFI